MTATGLTAVAVLFAALALRRRLDADGPFARLVVTGLMAGALTRHALVAGASMAIVELVLRRRRVRAEARASAKLSDAIPEVVDLFRLAAAAGLPVASALRAVAERAPPPVHHQLAEASRRLSRGLPLDDVLGQLALALGPRGGPLVAALRHSAATGVALSGALAELASRERAARRASTRAAVGRLTVTMVLPLVCCILPAAVALAIVPVVLVSFSALSG